MLYENGPVNGTTDAWTINFGYIVGDSFTLPGGAIVQDFDIWVWEFAGDTVSTVEWSITSQENGGMVFGSGTASVSDSFISTNQFGYDVDQLTVSGLSVPLPAGEFWLNLQNATVPSGDPVYWDENSGAGCHSPNCPSNASESSIGTIPSEAFDITGMPANPATTTTLAVAPPSPVVAGQVVTLTATVTSMLGPVQLGTVTFSDSNRKQVLGTVQLVQVTGMATLKIRFAPGDYSFVAKFNGTNSFQPSQSAVEPYTVTGTEPTMTTLTATPDKNNYDFTDSIFGFGFPAPTGTASFTDLTTMINVGSVGVVGPGTLGFQLPAPFPTGNFPQYTAVGDFNGDGFPDLVVANDVNMEPGTVSVLLGNGDGTFQPQQTYSVGMFPFGIAVADLNGDGFPDIVTANAQSNTVSVLLGKGDGTFQPQQTYAVGVVPRGIAVADFNGDGIPDLVVVNEFDFKVGVLLGNGDGTFQPQQTYPTGNQQQAYFVVVADFNGDGIPDLAVADPFFPDTTVSVLLGKGDGSFGPPQNYAAGSQPLQIVTGDFNGDGIPDLAVSNTPDQVSVLLGNGDGSFQPPTQYSAGFDTNGLAVTDFNGDGILDLVVANEDAPGTVRVLLGNGDGTFQPQLTYPAGFGPGGIAVADFNGDGVPDVAAVSNNRDTVSILLGGTVTTGTLKNVPVTGVGNQNIQSCYTPDNGFYAGSCSKIVPVGGNGPIATMTTVTSVPNPSQFNQPVTITATVFGIGGGSPTGTVNFSDSKIPIPGCTGIQLAPQQNSSTATCQTATLTVGGHKILADYSGDNNFNPSEGELAQQVNKAATTTTLTAVPPSPSTFGQLVTFTATVTGQNGGGPGQGLLNFIPGLGDSLTIGAGNGGSGGLITDFFNAGGPCGGDCAIVGGYLTLTSGGEVSGVVGGGSAFYTYASGGVVRIIGEIPELGINSPATLLSASFAPSETFSVAGMMGTFTGQINAASIFLNSALGSYSFLSGTTVATSFDLDLNCASGGNCSGSVDPVLLQVQAVSGVLQFFGNGQGLAPSPLGTVNFTADGTPIKGCGAVQLVPQQQNGSTAGCRTSSLAVGQHQIVATYNGDDPTGGFMSSQSAPLPYLVNKDATTTQVISAPNPSQLNQRVIINAVVMGAFGSGPPTGTADFTDTFNGIKTILCVGVQLDASGTAKCATQNLSVGVHDQIVVTYNGDQNFLASNGTDMPPQVVNKVTTTTQLTSSANPAGLGQPVTFTATVTASDGSSPRGSVTFQSNGVNIPDCPNPANLVKGVAACTTQSLAAGQDTILASFNDPQGFYGSSNAMLVQQVGDFTLPPISPGSVKVTQGFTNANDPFFAQTINLTVQSVNGYNGTVTLSCSVSPALSGGSCVVNQPSSGSLAGGNLSTTLTISAGGATPYGPYTVTVTGQDNTGLMHFTTLALMISQYSQGVSMPPGGGKQTQVSYNGPMGTNVGNLMCPLVSGTGISGTEDFSKIGGVCTFSPGTLTLPGTVMVTISGCTVARLRTGTRIFATLWLGMPAVMLLGCLRIRKLPRKRMLQLVGILLLLPALLLGVSCGGGSGQLTPTGNYLVLVQGTGSDGVVYSAVVPVTVTSSSQ